MPVIEDVLWKHPGNPGLIVVSSHAGISSDGRLAMEGGPGREAVARIPSIEAEAAKVVRRQAKNGVYGFVLVRPPRPDERLVGFGLFQTRATPIEPASLDLIRRSMDELREFALERPELKIRMNFPGVGAGGLPATEVAPLLLPLPPSVTVCHQGEVETSIPEDFGGFKALYVKVENLLKASEYDQAVELLLHSGFDIASAFNQVNAVQRVLSEREHAQAKSLEKRKIPARR